MSAVEPTRGLSLSSPAQNNTSNNTMDMSDDVYVQQGEEEVPGDLARLLDVLEDGVLEPT